MIIRVVMVQSSTLSAYKHAGSPALQGVWGEILVVVQAASRVVLAFTDDRGPAVQIPSYSGKDPRVLIPIRIFKLVLIEIRG